jgi:hypothetical protein
MSLEGFSGDQWNGYDNAEVIAENLGKMTEGLDVRIIVYLRRQDNFLESLYTQGIREGKSWTFAEFLRRFDDVSFNWELLLRSYTKFFGRDNLVTRVYSKERLPEKHSILDDFASIIGSKTLSSGARRSSTPNVGFSRDALEITRLTNPYLDKSDQTRLRVIFQKTSAKQPFEGYSYFGEQERNIFMARYSQSNAAVARKYFDDPTGTLFPPSSASSERPVYPGLTPEGVAIVLTKAMLHEKHVASHQIVTVAAIEKVEKGLGRMISMFSQWVSRLRRLPRSIGLA